MNAGPDIERAISTWLAEEAPARAPDRVLDDAARTIDRTKQRRFGAAWREPMSISTWRLVAAAVLIVAAVVGAGWIGRSTAPNSQGSTPSAAPASPTQSPAVTLEGFRAARNAICATAMPAMQSLLPAFEGAYDPGLSAAQRATRIAALDQIVANGQQELTRLGGLAVPPEIAVDQVATLARGQDVLTILTWEVDLLSAGKLAEAQALDQALGPISGQIEAFERKYGLDPCP